MAHQKPTVALVTGANKGIGHAIVRKLCEKLGDNGVVYLAARNEKLGHEAVQSLEKEGLHPRFVRLDLQDAVSIDKARDEIKQNHGGLDILVNNAGFAFKQAATEPFGEQAEVSVRINYTGTLRVCHAFFLILNDHARVVNVSSRAGNVAWLSNEQLKSRVISPDLSLDELNGIMEKFVAAAKEGTHQQKGYPNTAYGMSKIGLTAATRILQKQTVDMGKKDVVVNACCPGYVATDMSSYKGHKTTEEGADTPVYLSLLPRRSGSDGDSDIPVAQFVAERNVLDWTKGFDMATLMQNQKKE